MTDVVSYSLQAADVLKIVRLCPYLSTADQHKYEMKRDLRLPRLLLFSVL